MSQNGICLSLPQGQVRGGMGPARLDEAQGRGGVRGLDPELHVHPPRFLLC